MHVPKRSSRTPVVFVIAALLVASLAGALRAVAADLPREVDLELDPAATRVGFTLDATLHTVHGTFTLKRGGVRFDPKTGAAEGEIVLDAASGDSGNAKRDGAMRSDVLGSERYPEIRFVVHEVVGDFGRQGTVAATARGDLEIHGGSHPLALAIRATPSGERVTLATTFSIPYVEWGLRDPSFAFLRVAKEVKVEVEATGRWRAAPAR